MSSSKRRRALLLRPSESSFLSVSPLYCCRRSPIHHVFHLRRTEKTRFASSKRHELIPEESARLSPRKVRHRRSPYIPYILRHKGRIPCTLPASRTRRELRKRTREQTLILMQTRHAIRGSEEHIYLVVNPRKLM